MSKQGKKTMTLSLLIGIPGPIVTAIGMIIGKSTTQFADFIRRAIELLAIISSFIIYNKTTKDNHYNLEKKEKLEKVSNKVVAVTMIICGLIMLILGLITQSEEKGNVIPGLIISFLGFVTNVYFWVKYSIVHSETNNSILKVQSKLYRSKTFVDFSVFLTLFMLIVSKNSTLNLLFDLIGTILVSSYIIITGIRTLIKNM